MSFEATQDVFGFVGSLPKKERSAREKAMEDVLDFRRRVEVEKLIPPGLACELAQVSQQRLSQLCDEGKVEFVRVRADKWIKEDSLLHYCKTRKVGRPSLKGLAKASIEVGKDFRK